MSMTVSTRLSERQRAALAAHFEPRWGSLYWLERQAACGWAPGTVPETWDDLRRLGLMDEQAMRERPVEHFIPRSVLAQRPRWIRSESGGRTGPVKRTVYNEEEFHAAFIEPLGRAGRAIDFPRGGNWLFIGPSGPHLVGRVAVELARAQGGSDPFMVDFDVRWYRRLAPGSIARERYLAHVIDQALAVLRHESVDVLFANPRLLEALAARMNESERAAIRGVYYAGATLTPGRYREFRQRWFPAAVHQAAYGNSLFGACLEIPAEPERPRLEYYLPHETWVIELIDGDRPEAFRPAPPDARGRVLAHRFSRNHLILNLLEPDEATCIEPNADAVALGFVHGGLADPSPAASNNGPMVDRP